jgi:hypothetical protein
MTGSSLAGWRQFDPPAGAGALAPRLEALGANDLLLSWLEPLPGGGHAFRVARAGRETWTAPVTIAEGGEFFANWADTPGVAVVSDRDLIAHWLAKFSSDTYAYGVHLARSADGGATWRAAGLLHDDRSATEHGFVSWLGARAVWLDGRLTAQGGPMTLRSALVSEKPEPPNDLLDEKVCDCCSTAIAETADGPIVVYRDRSDGELRDIWRVRRSGGKWSAPAAVAADGWRIEGCPVNGPAVVAHGKEVAVAWFTGAPPKPRVLMAFSLDSGESFAPPIVVDDGQPLGRVGLVIANGDAQAGAEVIVTWVASSAEGAQVLTRRVRRGLAGPTVQLIATTAARASGFPRPLVRGQQLFLAWTEDTKPSRLRVGSLPLSSIP